MTDLTDKQAALTTKLVGVDALGEESNFADIDANRRLQVLAFQGTSPWVVSASQSGTWTTGRTWVLASGTDSISCVQSTNPWVISGTVIANEDKNYGVVGANTLRTAAQIGNATGQANFGAGPTGAQTLRTESNQGAPNTVANAWPAKITDGTNTAKVTATLDLRVSDVLDNGGVDGYVALNIFPVELKVGASIKTDRKFVILQGKSNYIVWGFSNTTQSFSIAYNQFVMVPLAPGTTIWAKVTAGGSGLIAVGEVS